MYLMRDNNNNGFKWQNTPPKTAQSWVRSIFGDDIINKLPKMNPIARKQIEQLNGQGHYYDNPIAVDDYTFDDKIDLTTTDASDNDIEIISEKKDLEYAQKLQALFDYIYGDIISNILYYVLLVLVQNAPRKEEPPAIQPHS